MNTIETRLQETGTVIPDMPVPLANYVPAKRTGNLVFTAGQICSLGDKKYVKANWAGTLIRNKAKRLPNFV